MSDEQSQTAHGASEAGIAAVHPEAPALEILAGPATASEFNTARLRPISVACWRVDDIRFDFDSSVVKPEIATELQHLSALVKAHPDSPLSIFGHADPVGNDEYNKTLSGRRAAAIYGLLTRRDEIWEDLYSNSGVFAGAAPGDTWGTKSIQIMVNQFAGPVAVDNKMGPETHDAIKAFQQDHGLAADGSAGPATRKKLFLAYMDKICVDDKGAPFQLDPQKDFLAHHQDTAGKGDYQGCGEFNPKLIFSTEENDEFEAATDKSDRNAANAPNRRVIALLFRKGTRVDPQRWPCPRAKEPRAACRKRFWSDGDARRNTRLPDKERTFEETRDTFACRFFQRMSGPSPCEQTIRILRIRLFDFLGNLLPGAPFLVKTPTREIRDTANDAGEAILFDVPVPSVCTVKWSRPKRPGPAKDDVDEFEQSLLDDGLTAEQIAELRNAGKNQPEFEFETELLVELPTEAEDADEQRLKHLGYISGLTLTDNVRAFQRDAGQQMTGVMTDVKPSLEKFHDVLAEPPLANDKKGNKG